MIIKDYIAFNEVIRREWRHVLIEEELVAVHLVRTAQKSLIIDGGNIPIHYFTRSWDDDAIVYQYNKLGCSS